MSHHSFTQRALRTLRPLRRPLSLLKGRLVSSDRATIISPTQLIICVALFIGLFNNYSFFSQVWAIYPPSGDNLLFVGSLFCVLLLFTTLLISVFAVGPLLKPALIATLLVSANTGYIMDTYHIVIDDVMLDNMLRTDRAEAFDLLSASQALYFIALGVLPSVAVAFAPVRRTPYLKAAQARLGFLCACLFSITALLLLQPRSSVNINRCASMPIQARLSTPLGDSAQVCSTAVPVPISRLA